MARRSMRHGSEMEPAGAYPERAVIWSWGARHGEAVLLTALRSTALVLPRPGQDTYGKKRVRRDCPEHYGVWQPSTPLP